MNNPNQRAWPGDVDGDVFRRLDAHGFDFSNEVNIDFNIDFDTWPPSAELLKTLKAQFGHVEVYLPDSSGGGYVQITRRAPLTYDLVMSTQACLTRLAAPYGGICESWGVLQD